jgi:hypothetical protein
MEVFSLFGLVRHIEVFTKPYPAKGFTRSSSPMMLELRTAEADDPALLASGANP